MAELRLPECVSAGFQVVPAYDTLIVPLDSGKEQRNINRTRARRKFTGQYRNFSREDFAQLLAMFHVCRGSGYSFRFKDWTDYEATNEPLGPAPSGTTAVQLTKTYTQSGGTDNVRAINKPNLEGFVLRMGGTVKTGTLDTTTGRFTPTTAWTPGAALTWSGTHDVWVRFASDELPSAFETNKNYVTTDALLIEDLL